MGLVDFGDGPLNTTDRRVRTLMALESAGIGRTAVIELRRKAIAGSLPAEDTATLHALQALNSDLEESPVPDSEWKAVRSVLGAELLSHLLNVSETSVRRYERGERSTPDDVAFRLHSLALIVADLSGGYNEFGIRRWFGRERSALEGRAPIDVLHKDWNPDDPGPTSVRDLAARLTGMGAT